MGATQARFGIKSEHEQNMMDQKSKQKIFTVVGSTSDIGKAVAGRLSALGHTVRKVSRTEGVSIDNTEALQKAFQEVDGAYLVIPFDVQAPDLHAREDQIGKKLAGVVAAARVRRVVFLSSLSAHLTKSTTSTGAAMMEKRLLKLGVPELMILRCGFFMENFLRGMNFIQQIPSGFFVSSFKGDIPMPMIACKDVAEKVAEFMTAAHLPEKRVQELLGARDYTFVEATRIMGKTLGHPEFTYREVPVDEAQKAMLAAGVSPSFADAVMKTAKSFNARDQWSLEKRSPQNTTATTLEEWSKDVLPKVFEEPTASAKKREHTQQQKIRA
jgi:uncharacterized protein YbjT (DUF2867 family)